MSHFAKRHYEAVALVMQNTRPNELDTAALDQWRLIQDEFEQLFAADNRQFNPARFAFACKPGSNVKAKTAHLKA